MVYCNYLNNRGFCKHGCSRVNGTQQIVCHQFARGRCKKSGKACYHGLHCWREKPTPTQPQGDGFRPRATETKLQKHLATLMLSPKCEDLLDLDSEILEAVYRKIAVQRHPDKASQADVCRPASVRCDRFLQLQMAKEYVKDMIPFRIATATDTPTASEAAITDLPPSSPTPKRMPRGSSRRKQSTRQFAPSVVYEVASDSNME